MARLRPHAWLSPVNTTVTIESTVSVAAAFFAADAPNDAVGLAASIASMSMVGTLRERMGSLSGMGIGFRAISGIFERTAKTGPIGINALEGGHMGCLYRGWRGARRQRIPSVSVGRGKRTFLQALYGIHNRGF